MSDDSDKVCGTCPFYNRRDVVKGECRREPPRFFPQFGPHPVTGELTMTGGATVSPVVKSDQWCGEHPERKRAASLGDVLLKGMVR